MQPQRGEEKAGKRGVVIFDIDNCIVDNSKRVQMARRMLMNDWLLSYFSPATHRFDGPVKAAIEATHIFAEDYDIVYLTNRTENTRSETMRFFELHGYASGHLVMHPDTVMFNVSFKPNRIKHILGMGYEVKIIYDDEAIYINKYRRMGLPAYQVKSLNDWTRILADLKACMEEEEDEDDDGEGGGDGIAAMPPSSSGVSGGDPSGNAPGFYDRQADRLRDGGGAPFRDNEYWGYAAVHGRQREALEPCISERPVFMDKLKLGDLVEYLGYMFRDPNRRFGVVAEMRESPHTGLLEIFARWEDTPRKAEYSFMSGGGSYYSYTDDYQGPYQIIKRGLARKAAYSAAIHERQRAAVGADIPKEPVTIDKLLVGDLVEDLNRFNPDYLRFGVISDIKRFSQSPKIVAYANWAGTEEAAKRFFMKDENTEYTSVTSSSTFRIIERGLTRKAAYSAAVHKAQRGAVRSAVEPFILTEEERDRMVDLMAGGPLEWNEKVDRRLFDRGVIVEYDKNPDYPPTGAVQPNFDVIDTNGIHPFYTRDGLITREWGGTGYLSCTICGDRKCYWVNLHRGLCCVCDLTSDAECAPCGERAAKAGVSYSAAVHKAQRSAVEKDTESKRIRDLRRDINECYNRKTSFDVMIAIMKVLKRHLGEHTEISVGADGDWIGIEGIEIPLRYGLAEEGVQLDFTNRIIAAIDILDSRSETGYSAPGNTADELLRALSRPNPIATLRAWQKGGRLAAELPELERLVGLEQLASQKWDAWEHTLAVVRELPRGNVLLRLAGLLHDIGKPDTVSDSFIEHGKVGAPLAEALMRRLNFEDEIVNYVVRLVRVHDIEGYSDEWPDSYVRSLVDYLGMEGVDDLIALRLADAKGHGVGVRKEGLFTGLSERARKVCKRYSASVHNMQRGAAGVDDSLVSRVIHKLSALGIEEWHTHNGSVYKLFNSCPVSLLSKYVPEAKYSSSFTVFLIALKESEKDIRTDYGQKKLRKLFEGMDERYLRDFLEEPKKKYSAPRPRESPSSAIPATLYHGTFKFNLYSIFEHGLLPSGNLDLVFPETKPGYVYMTSPPGVRPYRRQDLLLGAASEWPRLAILLGSRSLLTGRDITPAVVSIDTSQLDRRLLSPYRYGERGWRYRGVVPPSAIELFWLADKEEVGQLLADRHWATLDVMLAKVNETANQVRRGEYDIDKD